jgi:hypothetical protein
MELKKYAGDVKVWLSFCVSLIDKEIEMKINSDIY